jgi:hypothetical protein
MLEVGNNLADYQDQGGVVVGATFDWEGTGEGYDLAGRWILPFRRWRP